MKVILITLIFLCRGGAAVGDTIHVTVGDTGCPGRQTGVTGSWEKIPGVVSVTVMPRQPKDPSAQRVFVIVSQAASPTEESLREALNRRARHYPILEYKSQASPVKTVRK
jgi:hypothetical protein